MAMRKDIKNLSLSELEQVILDFGYQKFHARQLLSWLYKKQTDDFDKMSDLPEKLRSMLKNNFIINSVSLINKLESGDGTKKFLLELGDKNTVEAVIIPATGRGTGCVSTQVGCRFKCSFCASGMQGFKRNLTAGEIIDEVLCLKNGPQNSRFTHLVFMGTGEPMDNYDNVLKAIRIINSPDGINIGARRITISTCGIIPGIERLSKENLQIELSISLHSADDKIRSAIMPVNKIYPLKNLMSACRGYIKKTRRQITFEYILLKDINSDLLSARKLAILVKGLNCKVNLIPANIVKKTSPPEKKDILLFRDTLVKSGVHVTLRRPRGQDINAACGQLSIACLCSDEKK